MSSGEETIPISDFRKMIEDENVQETSSGQGGIIYVVLNLLKRNALTIEALCEKTGKSRNTILNAINHARTRKNKDIRRYINPKDLKFYYHLKENQKELRE